MDAFTTPSGRTFAVLPVDATRGFPQRFEHLYGERTYRFTLYVNVAHAALSDEVRFLDLAASAAFLVVRVETAGPDGAWETLLARRVVPGLEYRAGRVVVTFPELPPERRNLWVARGNLNGQGELGSRVVGGIAPLWA